MMNIGNIATFTSMCMGTILGYSMANHPFHIQMATGLIMAANAAIVYSVLKLALGNNDDADTDVESNDEYSNDYEYEGDYTIIRTITKEPAVEKIFDNRLFCPPDV